MDLHRTRTPQMRQRLTDTAIKYTGGQDIDVGQLCHRCGHQHQNGEGWKVFQTIGMRVRDAVQQGRIIGVSHAARPMGDRRAF